MLILNEKVTLLAGMQRILQSWVHFAGFGAEKSKVESLIKPYKDYNILDSEVKEDSQDSIALCILLFRCQKADATKF